MDLKGNEYERKRRENMLANEKMLQELELAQMSEGLFETGGGGGGGGKRKGRARASGTKRQRVADTVPTRRSARLSKQEEDKKEELVSLPDDFDDRKVSLAKAKRQVPAERMLGPVEMADVVWNHRRGTAHAFVQDVVLPLGGAWSATTDTPLADQAGYKLVPSVKAVDKRPFSIAFHPSTDRLIAIAGDKTGQLGFWLHSPDGFSGFSSSSSSSSSSVQKSPAKKGKKEEEEEAKGKQGEEIQDKKGEGEEDELDEDGVSDDENDVERTILKLQPHTRVISAIQCSPLDGNRVFTCGYDGVVRYTDMEKEVFVQVYSTPDDWRAVCLTSLEMVGGSPHTMMCSTNQGAVALLDDREDGSKVKWHDLHDRKIGQLACHPTHEQLMLTSSLDTTICLWDRRKLNKEPLLTLDGQSKASNGIAFSPLTGTRITSVCYDDYVRVWDFDPGASKVGKARQLKHNNNTGRWVTPFKIGFDLKDETRILVGNMRRAVDIFVLEEYSGKVDTKKGPVVKEMLQLADEEEFTAIPSLNATHPSLDAIACATASGRTYMWLGKGF